MLRLVLLFLCVSLIAGLLGFPLIAQASATTAKVIFLSFLALFLFGIILIILRK